MSRCSLLVLLFSFLLGSILQSCKTDSPSVNTSLSKSQLFDKIKGGWAGQAIGVSFGSHTEFKYQGTFIQDYQEIEWHEGYVGELMDSWPDLYDDIYMDLTFVDVLERVGMDAPVDSFAMAFATADYNLWHANQAARYNILHGVKESGHWMTNPHADDIDYQIEADFAGLMNPGMPNSASEISDKIGHIMCYGDGWYGGIYVGAMYALAFVSDDVHYVVKEALKAIPVESTFYQCIADVIRWHKEYPDDWKQTWFEIQRNWAEEIGCPDGVYAPFNIDAKVNAAYIVLGLLYGDGDFTKTMEISTRAGQDSDCNPSSAGGILGVLKGYSGIPEYWLKGLKGAEDKDFKYTSLSLNELYQISFKHALAMIEQNGGSVSEEHVTLPFETPEPVRLEQSFEGLRPVSKTNLYCGDIDTLSFDIEGTGFVLRGETVCRDNSRPGGVLKAKLYIDDSFVEEAEFPANFHDRRLELFWNYQLQEGKHNIKVVVDKHSEYALMRSWDYIVYTSDK